MNLFKNKEVHNYVLILNIIMNLTYNTSKTFFLSLILLYVSLYVFSTKMAGSLIDQEYIFS